MAQALAEEKAEAAVIAQAMKKKKQQKKKVDVTVGPVQDVEAGDLSSWSVNESVDEEADSKEKRGAGV